MSLRDRKRCLSRHPNRLVRVKTRWRYVEKKVRVFSAMTGVI